MMKIPGIQTAKKTPYFYIIHLNPLLRSGKLYNIAIENGPFIVDLPIKNGDFQELC